jgi:hypothetical protein
MNLKTERIFTITLTESEASLFAQYLDSVFPATESDRFYVPEVVKDFHADISSELMEVR